MPIIIIYTVDFRSDRKLSLGLPMSHLEQKDIGHEGVIKGSDVLPFVPLLTRATK
jgi:hypothetical protein